VLLGRRISLGDFVIGKVLYELWAGTVFTSYELNGVFVLKLWQQ
jgi:hypothetical protein